MNCSECGSVLPLDSPCCAYCGTLHAVDLPALGEYRVLRKQSGMFCPAGHGELEQWLFALGNGITAARCPQCFGMFMRRNAVDGMLYRMSEQVILMQRGRLERIRRHMIPQGQTQRRPCPVCQRLLVQSDYMETCPVQLETCAHHGVWLDNGELTLLAEWREAGGANTRYAGEAAQQAALRDLDRQLPGDPPYLWRFWPVSLLGRCLRIVELIIAAIFLWQLLRAYVLYSSL
ncbi:hypothetical protein [Chitinilyticum piscinae]|uniref:Uncharacterized protein n=1 Tax=Chitinilyticum piscinae TaxID=2866724 RepID=A0A8J7K0Y7_9NEIS|nr:hypothetical protein [Chitinilyticum piscinae]MBE9607807.1 hypothetical protein [Chitinilyticum piscinae]